VSARDPQRRDKLLDAAIVLILGSGVRRASVDEIARTAGVSKGAVYLEFASRGALLDALVRREYRRYLADALTRVEADPEGGRLSGIYRHSIAALLDRPFLRAMYEDNGQIVAELLKGPERYRPRVLLGAQFLGELADAGLLREDVDPGVVSHLLSVLVVGPLLAEPVLRDAAAPSLEATFGLLADLVVSGLEPRERRDPAPGIRAFRTLVEGINQELADDSAAPGLRGLP
jgi:AcrR family transcriptional regulator